MTMNPNNTGFMRHRNANIYFEVFGKGEPLVLLHGNGEDLSTFHRQIDKFCQYYQVIAIDTRGHGKSERGSGALDFIVIAEDVLAIFQHLKVEKAHLLGFSDGGNAALQFALLYPDRLHSLILIGANLDPKGVKPSAQIPIVIGYGLCAFFALFSNQAKKNKDILGLMVKHPHLTMEQLAFIQLPTLVMAGEHDMIKATHTQAIAESIKNAQLVIVPKADHFLPGKHPQECNAAILDFLQRQQSKPNHSQA